jgi:hypothetical protein
MDFHFSHAVYKSANLISFFMIHVFSATCGMSDCLLSHYQIYLAFVAGIIVCRIPFVGRFPRVLNTMIHESGHAFMALLTSGEVKAIELASDASGTARTGSKNFFSRLLTVMAGYTFASFFSFLSVWLLMHFGYTPVLYIFLSFALVNLMLWVRNTFGIVWILLFLALCGSVWLYLSVYVGYLVWFFCGILWFESLFTSFILLREAFRNPAKAGDAAALKEILFFPAAVWAILFTCFALWMNYLAVMNLPCLNKWQGLF